MSEPVKEVTGKTTSEHIADRIVKEARALLLHTNWNISEIAYSPGFEYPAFPSCCCLYIIIFGL